jgi:hypothetical protein
MLGGNQMNKYRVLVKELSVCAYEVEASSMEEAINKVADGGGDTDGFPEYHSTLNPDEWVVEKYDDNGECIDCVEAEYVLAGNYKEKV